MSSYDPGSGPSFPDYGDVPGGGLPGRYGPVPDLPGARRRLRPRGRLGCLGLLVVLVIVLGVTYIVPNPWALHIGGRFNLLGEWDGYGPVQASNGSVHV